MFRETFLKSDRTDAFPSCRFEWKCSYMGTLWFSISDETGSFEAELRLSLGDYERSILNPNPPDYARQVETEIGLLRRCVCDNQGEILPSTVAAFNAWRASEFNRQIAFMKANPERFGNDFSDFAEPEPVAAGRWTRGIGWQRVEPVGIALAA